MTCPCEKRDTKSNACEANTPPVIEVHSEECPVLFHTVNITPEQGDKDTLPPVYGAYRNTRVYYEANRMSYLYDSDGIPQILSGTGADGVSSVNGQAGDVIITPENIGAATATALDSEIYNRTVAVQEVAGDLGTLSGTVADNTAAIATKANAADVYTQTQVDNLLDAKANVGDVPTTYWGQAIDNGVVTGDIALGSADVITWGENNPSITGSSMDSITIQSGTVDSDTDENHCILAVNRTGVSIDHFENGDWTGEATLSGVKAGIADTDAVNYSQIKLGTWASIGTASSYNKAGAVVCLTISESITATANVPLLLFTLPDGYQPSVAVTTIVNVGDTFTPVPATVVVDTDGTVTLYSDSATADTVIGSVTFLA